MKFHVVRENLETYTRRYFQHHVAARVSMHPAPVNEHEVRYLCENFQRIAPLDFFLVDKGTMGNAYGTQLRLLLSSRSYSLLAGIDNDPRSEVTDENDDVLQLRQLQICNELHAICSIPRYTYIQNSLTYSAGSELAFRYKLVRNQAKFTNFNVTASTIDHPFCTIRPEISSAQDLEQFKQSIRHNFQKFHKLQFAIEVGPDAVRQITS